MVAEIQSILELKEAWGGEVRLSLHGSNIHVAIQCKQNLFEPDVKRPVNQADQVRRLLDAVRANPSRHPLRDAALLECDRRRKEDDVGKDQPDCIVMCEEIWLP